MVIGRTKAAVLAVATVALLVGCEKSSPPRQSFAPEDVSPLAPLKRNGKKAAKTTEGADPAGGVDPANKQPEIVAAQGKRSVPRQMPSVLLSEQHRKSSKVVVGDRMPNFALKDAAGKEHALSDFLGPRPTVVFFFHSNLPAATQQLMDIGPEVAARYTKEGIKVVGVILQEPRESAAKASELTGGKFPILIDEDGAVFKRLASDYLPRTYLLDSEGNILWFDLEYSATTRRQLDEAIRYSLAKNK